MIQNPYLDALKEVPMQDHQFLRYPEYKCFSHDQFTFKDHREPLVKEYSWAIPSHEALKSIVAFSHNICEIGAGTGYWAWMLSQYGANIVAYDLAVPGRDGHDNKWGHKRTWFDVKHGDILSVTLHQDRALMLCWPPYSNSMSQAIINLYTGKKIIYIGEGNGGCTACDEFFDILYRDFNIVDEVNIPNWDGLHDSLYLAERK